MTTSCEHEGPRRLVENPRSRDYDRINICVFKKSDRSKESDQIKNYMI